MHTLASLLHEVSPSIGGVRSTIEGRRVWGEHKGATGAGELLVLLLVLTFVMTECFNQ
jgi:hypothetical protein